MSDSIGKTEIRPDEREADVMQSEFDDRRAFHNPDDGDRTSVPSSDTGGSPRPVSAASEGESSGQAKSGRSSTSWQRRVVRMLVLFIVVPYLIVLLLMVVMQRRLLYPAGHGPDLTAAATGLPAGAVSDVLIMAADGTALHGLLYRGRPARPADHATEETPATDKTGDAVAANSAETRAVKLLIFFPGNAGHRLSRRYSCQEFARLGLDVLLVDYRGYGDNDGAPTEDDIARDVRLVWQYATGELGRAPEEIVIFGESLGGAVATRLVSDLCREGIVPAGLVLQSTFASLADVAAWHFRGFPVRWLLYDRFPSVERIPRVTCPILMFHGKRDSIVPFSQGEKLFAAAPPESRAGLEKRFVTLQNSGHNDISAGTLAAELTAFLHRVETTETEPLPAEGS